MQNAEALVGKQVFLPVFILSVRPLFRQISPMPQEKLEGEILKKLKMQGFVLENPQVVKMMDGN